MSNKTAVEFLIEKLIEKDRENSNSFTIQIYFESNKDIVEQAKELEKQHMIDLVQSLKDYTHESHNILGHDEREAYEFVVIHYKTTFNK